MAIRFRRSIKIAPGFRVNLGKRGVSVSAGIRGATITAGSRGVYRNVGLPGSGLSYRTKISGNQSTSSKKIESMAAGKVKIGTSLSLLEDGNVEIKDETGSSLPQKYVKIAREQNQEVFDKWLKNECDELNVAVDKILNIHFETANPNEETKYVPGKFEIPQPSFVELQPPKYKKVGFIGKFFKSTVNKVKSENAEIEKNYEEEKKVNSAKYTEDHANWERQKIEFEKGEEYKRYVVEKGRFENEEIMMEYLEKVLSEICWPRETLISLNVDRNSKSVFLDVDLPEIEDMPTKSISIAKNGLKLNIKDRSETQIRKDYMNHIHGIGFRVIGETFKALPACYQIIISGYSQRNNPATGKIDDEYLYSLKVTREIWGNINFENLSKIDIVECFGNFEIRRKMTKTGVFKPITPYDMQNSN